MLVMVNKFGDNLKKIRVEKNVSQQELADLISTHATHISRYERNMAAPSIDVVKKIAEALDVTTDTLIYGTQDEKVKNSLKDSEMLNMFIKAQSLTNKQQDTVKDLLSAFLLKSDLQKKSCSR
jgi:transcriptional regulator with XRE-family HTH domain